MTETLQITLAILLALGVLYAFFDAARRKRVAARAEARARSIAAHPAGKGR